MTWRRQEGASTTHRSRYSARWPAIRQPDTERQRSAAGSGPCHQETGLSLGRRLGTSPVRAVLGILPTRAQVRTAASQTVHCDVPAVVVYGRAFPGRNGHAADIRLAYQAKTKPRVLAPRSPRPSARPCSTERDCGGGSFFTMRTQPLMQQAGTGERPARARARCAVDRLGFRRRGGGAAISLSSCQQLEEARRDPASGQDQAIAFVPPSGPLRPGPSRNVGSEADRLGKTYHGSQGGSADNRQS